MRGGLEDVHGFEVQSTHAAHERLLKVVLHIDFLFVVHLNLNTCLVKLLPQRLDLLAVAGRDALNFSLYCPVEILFIFLNLPLFIMRLPSLENFTRFFFLVLVSFVFEDSARVLLPLLVLFEGHKSLEFGILEARHGLSFASPQGKNLSDHPVLVRFFAFERQILSKVLEFALLKAKHGVASTSFGFDSLSLLEGE